MTVRRVEKTADRHRYGSGTITYEDLHSEIIIKHVMYRIKGLFTALAGILLVL